MGLLTHRLLLALALGAAVSVATASGRGARADGDELSAQADAPVTAKGKKGGRKSKAGPPYYTLADGVRVSDDVRAKLVIIAERFYEKTRHVLYVTSGTRSPEAQATAMYKKLRLGDRLRAYRNRAAVDPLVAIYDKGRKKRRPQSEIVGEMARVIASQCERGVYLSRHLKAHAFDLRSYDLTASQRKTLAAIVREVGGVHFLQEKRPPHIHCELKGSGPPSADPE